MQKTLSALCDPTRREILKMLKKSSRSAGEIAQRFDLSLPAISRHLRVLEEAEIVISHREGKYIYYELTLDTLGFLADWLNDFLKEYE